MTKQIPVGIDNFRELVDPSNNFLFVDKSLLIKELLNSGTVLTLVTRPQGWGKTLSLSMLQHFFAPEVKGKPTKGLFDQLKIAKEEDGLYLKKQGTHPVILISFKTLKAPSWDEFMNALGTLTAAAYKEHETVLMQSDELSENDKLRYQAIVNKSCDQFELKHAISHLSHYLYDHYRQDVMILIDEYDTPFNAAYNKPYYEELLNFFDMMLGEALKGNHALEKGFMMGVLCKTFSGINHLTVSSLLDEHHYNQYFGFSEEEVKDLILASNTTVDLKELKAWYNGYYAGDIGSIYTPRSILNCIKNQGELKPYWIETGEEILLKILFNKETQYLEGLFTEVLEGSYTPYTSVDDYILDALDRGLDRVLWSLLWSMGFLAFSKKAELGGLGKSGGTLIIPNHEAAYIFREVFPKWIRALKEVP